MWIFHFFVLLLAATSSKHWSLKFSFPHTHGFCYSKWIKIQMKSISSKVSKCLNTAIHTHTIRIKQRWSIPFNLFMCRRLANTLGIKHAFESVESILVWMIIRGSNCVQNSLNLNAPIKCWYFWLRTWQFAIEPNRIELKWPDFFGDDGTMQHQLSPYI